MCLLSNDPNGHRRNLAGRKAQESMAQPHSKSAASLVQLLNDQDPEPDFPILTRRAKRQKTVATSQQSPRLWAPQDQVDRIEYDTRFYRYSEGSKTLERTNTNVCRDANPSQPGPRTGLGRDDDHCFERYLALAPQPQLQPRPFHAKKRQAANTHGKTRQRRDTSNSANAKRSDATTSDPTAARQLCRSRKKNVATDIPACCGDTYVRGDSIPVTPQIWDPVRANEAERRGENISAFLTQVTELVQTDFLMELLHNVDYSVAAAQAQYAQLRKVMDVPSTALSRGEKRKLILMVCSKDTKKDFSKISKAINRNIGDCLIEYYRWKGTEEQDYMYMKSKWRSDFCTICDDGGTLLICDVCERGYHLGCLEPPLREIPDGQWFCEKCECLCESQRLEIAIKTKQRIANNDDAKELISDGDPWPSLRSFDHLDSESSSDDGSGDNESDSDRASSASDNNDTASSSIYCGIDSENENEIESSGFTLSPHANSSCKSHTSSASHVQYFSDVLSIDTPELATADR